MYRLDHDQSFTNTTAIIQDFNEGVQYSINSRYDSCSILPINATDSSSVEIGIDGKLHLQTIKNHFFQKDKYKYVYEGVSQVRRVDTESWISLRDHEVFNDIGVLTNGYLEVFYTLPSWNIFSGLNKTTNIPVPWRFVIAGQKANSSTYFIVTKEVLEFRVVEPNFDVFDASVCFSFDQYTVLRLILPLPNYVSYSSMDHSLLRSRVRISICQAVNISASRIGAINVSLSTFILICHHYTYNYMVTI